MTSLIRSFTMFIRQISRDSMLYAVCIAPLLAALFFRFGIPYIEALLCRYFSLPAILADYYLLFDLFMAILTPFLFCFASSMVILTESDENMSGYLAVTPVGRKGYLVSRFVFPALISFFASVLLLSLFSLTEWPRFLMFAVCFLASLFSVVLSLLVVSFSHNRVEGMAVSKLSGIMMFGLLVPFFIFSDIQYLFAVLPSFWIAKLCYGRDYLFILPALLTSFLWLGILYRRFEKKLI
ncbi:MAG: ABC transporter permease [Eubacteriales bacterium]|nr:ABC transporter permease [Eubacteriales bacterium]